MRYLMFDSLEAAQAVSHAEALARGCGPVTLYWWSVEETVTGWAVCIPLGDEGAQINADALVDAIDRPPAPGPDGG
jgi:hypothetical protein